jgi:hypothetical protein
MGNAALPRWYGRLVCTPLVGNQATAACEAAKEKRPTSRPLQSGSWIYLSRRGGLATSCLCMASFLDQFLSPFR